MALVGIARLAAHAPLLDAKRQVEYRELDARRILNRTRPGMPFAWTVNPYRGCEYDCRYCYARYTHGFMELAADEFATRIYAKAAPAALLRAELARIPLADGIAIGTATDPYQPAERRYRRTRAVLEVLARERGRHVSIVTKSDLILRDLALLREVARGNVLNVSLTLTTVDDGLARALEPLAPRPELRLRALAELAEAGIVTGVMPNPLMPWITDGEETLERLARATVEAGGRHLGGGPLFLPSGARETFFDFLGERYPRLLPRYRALFAGRVRLGKEYRARLAARLGAVRLRHCLSSGPQAYAPELWQGDAQGQFSFLSPD